MKVLNVHERLCPGSEDDVGRLIDSLARPDDSLWPWEKWPAMRLYGALAEGTHGGHGPIGYFVELYEPSRRVRFRFTRPRGFVGFHEFALEKRTDGVALVHKLAAEMRGSALLSWPLLFRPLHDALIEDAFGKAEAVLAGSSARKVTWSPWVRFLRRCLRPRSSERPPQSSDE